MNEKVQILMSVYHGEKYIKEQLDSIIKQKDVDLKILIRIDGYNDSTKNIIEEYKKKYNFIQAYEGENLGYAKSFWNLVLNADSESEYYAFCDQDDIWDQNKMISAIEKMKLYKNTPVLYTSKVISVNNEMKVLNEDTFGYDGVLNKYESFQKSMFPGCVFVFNNRAKMLLKEYNGFMESHDWATYIIINSFGKVIYDNNSYIRYRIHESNTIGKKNKINTIINKLKNFFAKSKCTRSKFAKDFYETYSSNIKDEMFKESIKELAYYKADKHLKRKLLFNKNFKGIIFKIYILLNKV